MHFFTKSTLLTLSFFSIGLLESTAAHPSRGLWVGEVALDRVNEATGAVGDSNTYEFTDPEIVTPTSDTAFLRLIVHVNGAGQAQLLKSVAIVEGDQGTDGTTDLVLLTNPQLYPNYPGIAKRIATAFYDFGDFKSVNAVETLIDQATEVAVEQAGLGHDEATILAAINPVLNDTVDNADVELAYLNTGTGTTSFFTTSFFTGPEVETLANGVADLVHTGKTAADFLYTDTSVSYDPLPGDPFGVNFGVKVTAAENLRDDSFYGDTRGIEAIIGVVVAAAEAAEADPSADLATKQASARIAAEAAWFNAADLGQAYNQFISDEFAALPDVLTEVAVQVALSEEALGSAEATIVTAIKEAVVLETAVQNANTAANDITDNSVKGEFGGVTASGDLRARRAIDALINQAAETAAAEVLLNNDEALLTATVGAAVDTVFDGTLAGPVFADTPSPEYIDFVTGTKYSEAATLAAETAASEAALQYSAGETDPDRLSQLTREAVAKALLGTRSDAAVLPQNSSPLSGIFEAGNAVEGEFYLPALAPSNPFMHRLHSDHPEGIAIRRLISMQIDAPDSGSYERAGYGVSRLSGTYSEEIFGLHKPLGDSQNIGLRTQGSFTLNRLTLVDILNF